jgi:hypothetical protein
MTWSLVFVLKLISTFIGQNKELFFMHVLKKDVLYMSLKIEILLIQLEANSHIF